MESEWRRVTTSRRCPVCGKPDWCLVAQDNTAVICPRTPADKYIDGSGYLHVLIKTTAPIKTKRKPPAQLPEHNTIMSVLNGKYRKSLEPRALEDLTKNLGVSKESLGKLGIGWSETKRAFSFPMLRKGNRVLGIRFRCMNGQKFAAKGSKQGLFIPETFDQNKGAVICEGPTDTAAMIDLGFNAIGRPSCNSGIQLISELVKGLPVAIVADSDKVGMDGASKLRDYLRKTNKRVVIIDCNDHKDAREWLQSGATRQTVLQAIERSSKDA